MGQGNIFKYPNKMIDKEQLSFESDTSKDSVHEGKKSFECDVCFAVLKSKVGLERHISAVHDEKKPFKCGICDNSFS